MLTKKKGFTVIELLIVVAIIGILAAVAFVTTSQIRSRARDGKRVFDTQQITTALEAYYAKNKGYPTMITFGQPFKIDGITYMAEVPDNPEPRTDGNCLDGNFRYDATPQGYELTFCIGSDSGRLKKGINICKNGTCLPCGEYKVEDSEGNKYRTVAIGGQCWMAENLHIGTMITAQAQSPCINIGNWNCQNDNSLIEKYCYMNNAANCTIYGGLYEWQEAMALPASCANTDCSAQVQATHQGICPSGWHIPSDTEFNILEKYTVARIGSNVSQYPCDQETFGWERCGDDVGDFLQTTKGAGRSLKKVGQGSANGAGNDLVGFSWLLAGSRNGGASFSGQGVNASLWSKEAGVTSASMRSIVSFYATINRYQNSFGKTYGVSVRCIKNS